MNDREMIDRVYEALELGFVDTDVTVSQKGREIYLDADGQSFCLSLFTLVNQQDTRK